MCCTTHHFVDAQSGEAITHPSGRHQPEEAPARAIEIQAVAQARECAICSEDMQGRHQVQAAQ